MMAPKLDATKPRKENNPVTLFLAYVRLELLFFTHTLTH